MERCTVIGRFSVKCIVLWKWLYDRQFISQSSIPVNGEFYEFQMFFFSVRSAVKAFCNWNKNVEVNDKICVFCGIELKNKENWMKIIQKSRKSFQRALCVKWVEKSNKIAKNDFSVLQGLLNQEKERCAPVEFSSFQIRNADTKKETGIHFQVDRLSWTKSLHESNERKKKKTEEKRMNQSQHFTNYKCIIVSAVNSWTDITKCNNGYLKMFCIDVAIASDETIQKFGHGYNQTAKFNFCTFFLVILLLVVK